MGIRGHGVLVVEEAEGGEDLQQDEVEGDGAHDAADGGGQRRDGLDAGRVQRPARLDGLGDLLGGEAEEHAHEHVVHEEVERHVVPVDGQPEERRVRFPAVVVVLRRRERAEAVRVVVAVAAAAVAGPAPVVVPLGVGGGHGEGEEDAQQERRREHLGGAKRGR